MSARASAHQYLVRRARARCLWRPYSGWRWPPPRLVQLRRVTVCFAVHHDWSTWNIDDIDGPSEDLGDGNSMPLCSREARPGEFGIRVCRRCSAIEARWPADQAPPLFRGRRRSLTT